MSKKNIDPRHEWGFERLCQMGIDSKDEMLSLARDCPLDAPLANALDTMMDRSHGPELAHVHALADHIDEWRDGGEVSREWVVFVLLDLALQHAKQAPTVLEAAYPFMTAIARAAEDVQENKGYRDEHWVAEYGAGDCSPRGPPREPAPSWIDRDFLRQAEKNHRRRSGPRNEPDEPTKSAKRKRPEAGRPKNQGPGHTPSAT